MSLNDFANKKFWADAADRAIRTFAQSAIAMLGVKSFLNEIDPVIVFSSAGLAALLSILTSIARPGGALEA